MALLASFGLFLFLFWVLLLVGRSWDAEGVRGSSIHRINGLIARFEYTDYTPHGFSSETFFGCIYNQLHGVIGSATIE